MTTTISIKTELGNITADLYPQKAPVTVAKFLDNMAIGMYDNSYFFRSACSKQAPNDFSFDVIEAAKSDGKPEAQPIVHESNQVSDLWNTAGTLAMSRDEPGTAASGFFINVADNPVLDFQEATDSRPKREGYTVFGQIKRGMNIVRAIHQREKGGRELTDKVLNLMGEEAKNNREEAQRMLAQYLNRTIIIYSIDVVTENTAALCVEKI